MKKLLLLIVAAKLVVIVTAQPLFTYGKKTVSKEEFLRAFNKNPNQEISRQAALKEYLDLYINFKLKVQAAYDSSLHKDNLFQTETFNFSKQLAENTMNEEAKLKDLIQEAFERSQKDIRLSQILIEVPQKGDTAKAYELIWKAYKELQAGKDFESVTRNFSSDESTKQTNGDLGYITVFSLPYEFENIAYGLKQGKYSSPFRSSLGYHIFKLTGERNAIGKRKVAQILFAFPPNANTEIKNRTMQKADSVYQLIATGKEKFADMVLQFSNDMTSYNNGGQLPEFGVGQYDAIFEDAAFKLNKKGSISKPFATSYGVHILEHIDAVPVTNNANDAVFMAGLKEKVERDERLSKAKANLLNKWMAKSGYKPAFYDKQDLVKYIDSITAGKSPSTFSTVTDKTVLFSFTKQKITAEDFGKFMKALKGSGNALKNKTTLELVDEYAKVTATEYYSNHLADFNSDFKTQVAEFNEANLLFAIMDKMVWGKAGTDEAGLQKYYQEHKTKYVWQPSADAILFTCNNDTTLKQIQKQLTGNPMNWRSIAEIAGNNVVADSGRYELTQMPVAEKTVFKSGMITNAIKNTNDGTYTFAYILNMYSNIAQRSFEDAKGMVINDYQQQLEAKWIAHLKKKYPVKINETVWKTIK